MPVLRDDLLVGILSVRGLLKSITEARWNESTRNPLGRSERGTLLPGFLIAKHLYSRDDFIGLTRYIRSVCTLGKKI